VPWVQCEKTGIPVIQSSVEWVMMVSVYDCD